mgnify:CR=1 FL=1
MNELVEFKNILELKSKVLYLYDKCFKCENPNNKIFQNINLKGRLQYKYSKSIYLRNKISFTTDKKVLDDIFIFLKQYERTI